MPKQDKPNVASRSVPMHDKNREDDLVVTPTLDMMASMWL